ncbi:DUF488 family protein [Psychrobacter sp.]|uniref:DUF488 family protein n=1 Tax=Psychrobacter sp. TaxID=56811 RepID=UPI003BAF16DB
MLENKLGKCLAYISPLLKLRRAYIDKVKTQLEKHNVTFIYGAKDEKHNQVVVLKAWVEEKLNE